MVYLKR